MSDTNATTTTPTPEPDNRTSQAPVITIPAHTRHMADGSTQEVKAYTKPSGKGIKLPPREPRAAVKRDYKAERAARKAAVHTANIANKRGPYKAKQKPGPKPERPRFTSPTHAAYLRERLGIVNAFLVTIKHSTQSQDADVQQLLYECISIVKMVQLFVGRFTSNQPMED